MQGLNDVSIGARSGRTKLFLGAAGATVRADVHHRSADRLSVRHALPFLRLDSEVMDEDGRFARISSVRVYVEHDVPTLHMELLYPTEVPAPVQSGSKVRKDATLPYGIPTEGSIPPAAHAPARSRGDDTLMFGTDPGLRADSVPPAAGPLPTGLAALLSRLLRRVSTRLRRIFAPRLPAPQG
jgi:hypothetical protein